MNQGEPRISVTVVVCIESGILEPLTLRMVGSLRAFGGRFASADVVAVTPRLSPPLSGETRRQMAALGIRHLVIRPRNPYAWHHYTNKVEALAAVEQQVATNVVAWLDSDIIFTREPRCLDLPSSVDFAASAPDTGVIGSVGGSDPNDRFWGRAAALIGKTVDELPWLDTGDGHRIRFYWNSGVFAYRRRTGFGTQYRSDMRAFLDGRVARTHSQVHYADQVVLGLTVLRLGLSWRQLDASENFPLCSWLPGNYDPAKVADVGVLHFHDSMSGGLWGRFLGTIAPVHPSVYHWLSPMGPVTVPRARLARAVRELLRASRGLRRKLYYSRSDFGKHTRIESGSAAASDDGASVASRGAEP